MIVSIYIVNLVCFQYLLKVLTDWFQSIKLKLVGVSLVFCYKQLSDLIIDHLSYNSNSCFKNYESDSITHPCLFPSNEKWCTIRRPKQSWQSIERCSDRYISGNWVETGFVKISDCGGWENIVLIHAQPKTSNAVMLLSFFL